MRTQWFRVHISKSQNKKKLCDRKNSSKEFLNDENTPALTLTHTKF